MGTMSRLKEMKAELSRLAKANGGKKKGTKSAPVVAAIEIERSAPRPVGAARTSSKALRSKAGMRDDDE